MKTKIIPCVCEHAYQDSKYGKGNRVHNLGTAKTTSDVWSCTVCGRKEERNKTKEENGKK